MKFSLIIPTYNERENITVLINKLLKLLKPFNYEIIVVDDNSPDQTWKLVQDTYKKNKRVRIIRRMNKRERSSAIIQGFDKAKGDILGVMDADLQHDEKILPRMINYSKEYSLVVGSRFVKGGGMGKCSWFRMLESRTAVMLVKILFNIKIKDSGSEYFIVKKSLYKKIKPKLYGKGYKIMLGIYFNADIKSFKEVPYTFRPRKKGKSKTRFKDVYHYILMNLKFLSIRITKH